MIEIFVNYINTEAGLITIKVLMGLYAVFPLFFIFFSRMKLFGESTAVPLLFGLVLGLIFIFFTPDSFFRLVIGLLGMWIWAALTILVLIFPFIVVRKLFGSRVKLRKIFVVLFFLFALGLIIYSWNKSRTSIAIPWTTSSVTLMMNNLVYTFIIFILVIFGLYFFFIRD